MEHYENTQASDEDVSAIKQLAYSLLGRMFHNGAITGSGEAVTRLNTWEDMLFVGSYNYQISKLNIALGMLMNRLEVLSLYSVKAALMWRSLEHKH